MQSPKVHVFNILDSIDGVEVVQQTQNVFTELPVITYYIANTHVIRDLDNEIINQPVEVVIDIWTDTSTKGSELLEQVEEKMRDADFTCDFSADVPNPNDTIYHITTRFTSVNV